MTIEINLTPAGLRSLKRWKKKRPDLLGRFTERLMLFAEDPFHASLKTHALSGNLDGQYAFSVNFEYRVVFEFVDVEQTAINILSVGKHDEVY